MPYWTCAVRTTEFFLVTREMRRRVAALRRQVPATAKLMQAREQLSNLLRYMDGKVGAEDSLKKLLADPQLMAAMKAKLIRL